MQNATVADRRVYLRRLSARQIMHSPPHAACGEAKTKANRSRIYLVLFPCAARARESRAARRGRRGNSCVVTDPSKHSSAITLNHSRLSRELSGPHRQWGAYAPHACLLRARRARRRRLPLATCCEHDDPVSGKVEKGLEFILYADLPDRPGGGARRPRT